MIKNEIYKRILTSLVLLPIVIFSIFSSNNYFNIVLFIIFCLATYEWFNMNRKSYVNFFFGFLVIGFSMFSAYVLRGNDKESYIFFLWIILVVIFSDTGGYIFGKIIGGKKLTKISPSKTLAGVFGSFIFSTFPILIIYALNYLNVLISYNLTLSYKTFSLSLIFSLVAQLGDLTISYFKRKNKIKDTGNILPGHGGLLDRIDGLIFLLLFSLILRFLKII